MRLHIYSQNERAFSKLHYQIIMLAKTEVEDADFSEVGCLDFCVPGCAFWQLSALTAEISEEIFKPKSWILTKVHTIEIQVL